MKVVITYREVLRFEQVIEVEMTKAEYNQYLKMSEHEKSEKYDLCSSTCDEHHIATEPQPIIIEIVNL